MHTGWVARWPLAAVALPARGTSAAESAFIGRQVDAVPSIQARLFEDTIIREHAGAFIDVLQTHIAESCARCRAATLAAAAHSSIHAAVPAPPLLYTCLGAAGARPAGRAVVGGAGVGAKTAAGGAVQTRRVAHRPFTEQALPPGGAGAAEAARTVDAGASV